jgi:AcrR family transcriptional regulator
MAAGMKTGMKLSGEVRRDQIVQAALAVIAKNGVGGLTTAALAAEARVSEANLYRHFKNKEDIFFATVAYVKEKIAKNMEGAFGGTDAPVKKLKRFYDLQLELIGKNSGILRFMFSYELHISEKLREKLLQTMYDFSTTLATFIKDAQKAGSFRRDLDARTTSLMLIGMVQGLLFRWSLSGFSFSLAAEGRKLWKNFEKSIVVEK